MRQDPTKAPAYGLDQFPTGAMTHLMVRGTRPQLTKENFSASALKPLRIIALHIVQYKAVGVKFKKLILDKSG